MAVKHNAEEIANWQRVFVRSLESAHATAQITHFCYCTTKTLLGNFIEDSGRGVSRIGKPLQIHTMCYTASVQCILAGALCNVFPWSKTCHDLRLFGSREGGAWAHLNRGLISTITPQVANTIVIGWLYFRADPKWAPEAHAKPGTMNMIMM